MSRTARPFIGITADFVAAGKKNAAMTRLSPGYFDAVAAAGGLPVILPPLGRAAELEALLDRLDGVVFSGGLDLDPRKQGWTPHSAVQPMASRRDDSDRLLIQLVIERQMPVLAIGLGMQQLNAATGGTLFAHLPEDLPRGMPHRDPFGETHRHAVLVQPDTRLDEIYGCPELRVNSEHHQAVRTLGAGLRVCANAPDGVIEAIETEDANWFCVGVQWHPESETASALDGQLFECFVQASQRVAQPLKAAA
jgi:putative glutamine amidotransferase